MCVCVCVCVCTGPSAVQCAEEVNNRSSYCRLPPVPLCRFGVEREGGREGGGGASGWSRPVLSCEGEDGFSFLEARYSGRVTPVP